MSIASVSDWGLDEKEPVTPSTFTKQDKCIWEYNILGLWSIGECLNGSIDYSYSGDCVCHCCCCADYPNWIDCIHPEALREQAQASWRVVGAKRCSCCVLCLCELQYTFSCVPIDIVYYLDSEIDYITAFVIMKAIAILKENGCWRWLHLGELQVHCNGGFPWF